MSNEIVDFETLLADEWPRLVRLCTWFTGHEEAAQDLAQETLIAAWKSQDRLISIDKLKPWTYAIARNICLDRSRRYFYEQSHTAFSMDSPESSFEEQVADETDLELELDRYELANLLDRALSMLAAETGQMLIEHYIQESSHAEIAERMNLNPGTVAVRIQRGKLKLQKLFQLELQAEASPFGFLGSNDDRWEETNIWCINCGQSRLLGKYQKDQIFALRCPTCDPDPDMIMAGLDLTKPYHAQLLGNTKTYKPAYLRLISGLVPFYRKAIHSQAVTCMACGHTVDVRIDEVPRPPNYRDETKQIHLQCPACGWASNKAFAGLMISLPEVQKFWREHPRLRTLQAEQIEVDGAPAFVRRLRSVQDNAELTVISRLDSFDPLEIHTNVKL